MKKPLKGHINRKNAIAIGLLLFSLITGVNLIDIEGLAEVAGISTSATDQTPANDNDDDDSAFTHAQPPTLKADWEHILHGDRTGGGHLHGTGKPCKSEFPASWDEGKVKATIKRMAANDNAQCRREDNGYYVSEQTREKVRIRIVINGENNEIVTGYPTNLPRNPCNDHKNQR